MTKHRTPRLGRFLNRLGSNYIFWALIGVFCLQAVWIALSGKYPMAFDEDFHLGVIRLYAAHLSPFWSHQPENADMYGAVARDPSYLYHFLMSFPYRLITLFTHDQTIQVLWLRAINIGLFVSGLVLFRRVLRRSGASPLLVNTGYAALVLIPVMPLLAAQINYDNLLLPLTAVTLLLALRIAGQLRAGVVPVGRLGGLVILCLFGSLLKYAFLPIVAGVWLYLGLLLYRHFTTRSVFKKAVAAGTRAITPLLGVLLTIGLLTGAALFSERYVVNLVRYHTPIPDCGQVLDVESCSEYGPWIRDYTFTQTKTGATHNPLLYANDWFYGMWLRLFFAVDGPATNFETRGPLLLPALTSIGLVALAAVALLVKGRALTRRYDRQWLLLMAFVSLLYVGALVVDGYRAFLRTGQPVAINGRYLLPILLPLLLVAILAVNELLGRRRQLKTALLIIGLLGLLWGGGALTYLLRGADYWYWPNPTVRSVNATVRRTLGPVTPGYNKPTLFMH